MLTAYQLTRLNPGGIAFGMDKEKTAEVLRAVADGIASGDLILQSGGVYTTARATDYPMTVLNLKFHERGEAPPLDTSPKALYGTGQFPVDVERP